MGVAAGWVEVGDRVFVRRYAFYDQNIGVIIGDGEALVIDTRSTYPQAREDGLFRPVTHQAVTGPLAPAAFLPSVHVVHLGRSRRPSCAGSRA